MLNGKLTLHDIQDAEKFTARLIPPNLTREDREDLHAYLIAAAWNLSTKTPQPWTRSFSGWVTPHLRNEVTNWKRQRHGRTTWKFATHTHTRELPTIVSLDAQRRDDDPTATRDTPADRLSDSTWLHRTRGSDEAWRAHTRRQRLPRRAA